MTAVLFVGGPIHGEWREVKDTENTVRVPRTEGAPLPVDRQTGVPLLSATFATVTYVRRKIAHPSGHYRVIFVDQTLPPEVGMQALADILITQFVLTGPLSPVQTDAQAESGPEPGPAATLAGSEG